MEDVTYTPIGVIRTPFPDSRGIPKRPEAQKIAGTAGVFPRFAEGLADIEDFSHVVLLFHMHLSGGPLLKVVPQNEIKERGVLSTRSPRRPNPIGMTVVRLDRMDCNIVHFTGADMVDGTPLLDMKPYIPE